VRFFGRMQVRKIPGESEQVVAVCHASCHNPLIEMLLFGLAAKVEIGMHVKRELPRNPRDRVNELGLMDKRSKGAYTTLLSRVRITPCRCDQFLSGFST